MVKEAVGLLDEWSGCATATVEAKAEAEAVCVCLCAQGAAAQFHAAN